MSNETTESSSTGTQIAEYSQTEQALAELRNKYAATVFDVRTSKGMREAREARAEIKGYRVALEKKRVEIKAPALERCRAIDTEAKRITGELLKLEDPIDETIKAEEARKEEERLAALAAEQRRVAAIVEKIDAIRALPGTLVGKPSVVIKGQLAKLREQDLTTDDFAEQLPTAEEARDAAVARIEQQLPAQLDHEAEQKRIEEERAELTRMREENERLQRQAEERAAADARRERERVDTIQTRIQAITDFGRDVHGHSSETLKLKRDELQAYVERLGEFDFAEYKAQAETAYEEALAAIDAAIEREQGREEEALAREAEEEARREEEARQRAEEEARLQAERERLAEEQRQFAERQAEQRKKDEEARAQAEAERRANLTLRGAAQAIVDYFPEEPADTKLATLLVDLHAALANDAAAAAPAPRARNKKAAQA